jgi:hypothetical protein
LPPSPPFLQDLGLTLENAVLVGILHSEKCRVSLLLYTLSVRSQSHSLEILRRGLDNTLRLPQNMASLDRPEVMSAGSARPCGCSYKENVTVMTSS